MASFYVLRHGQSPSLSEAGVRHDAERPLSEHGREDVRAAARELAARGAALVVILHSPLKRAAQTAAEAGAILRPAHGVKAFEPLSNQVTGEMLYSYLQREYEDAEFLAVGHQPQLGELVAYLTGQVVEIRPGGLVALAADGKGKATLLWSINPG
ncbi:MAG: histidine phosphatase family protein [Elusimicrobia bacterium]|nr:histidine phosphatase family protein [Elusimicrobiota bacterium]